MLIMMGCCRDKKSGCGGCDESTCMRLPEGETCSSCIRFEHCAAIGCAKPANKTCDWFPRRFEKKEAEVI